MISDVIVLYVLKKRSFYKENKYQQVLDPEIDGQYEIINNPYEDPDTSQRQPLPDTVSCELNLVCAQSCIIMSTVEPPLNRTPLGQPKVS